jgi:hypothetical protein
MLGTQVKLVPVGLLADNAPDAASAHESVALVEAMRKQTPKAAIPPPEEDLHESVAAAQHMRGK